MDMEKTESNALNLDVNNVSALLVSLLLELGITITLVESRQ